MRLTALLIVFLVSLVSLASTASAETFCSPPVLTGIQISEKTAGYDISVEYPVLCSEKATRTVRDAVTKSLSDFKMDFPEHDLTDYPRTHQMITEYAVWPAGGGRLASVKIHTMVYTGGAHPNNWPTTWVFDMTNGHELTLDDIFLSKAEALIEISEIVRGVLVQSLGQMNVESMLMDGTTPTEKNYVDFILNDEGIVFFFAPYQVAPYAAGQQVVTIPYDRIEPFLTTDIKTVIQ